MTQSLEQHLTVDIQDIMLRHGGGDTDHNGNSSAVLIIVDAVRGFTQHGALADRKSMAPMVAHICRLSKAFLSRYSRGDGRIVILRDCHRSDVPEPPYPPHCVKGTGEEDLDPDLGWLWGKRRGGRVSSIDKDCINGFVGAEIQRPYKNSYYNQLVDELKDVRDVVIVGCCTDICVLDLVTSLLSARNHGMLTSVGKRRKAYAEAIGEMRIIVYKPGCATFDSSNHPGELMNHIGLHIMASRGALIAGSLSIQSGSIVAEL